MSAEVVEQATVNTSEDQTADSQMVDGPQDIADPYGGEGSSASVEGGGDPAGYILHPLESEWTLWYDKRPGQGKRLKGEQEAYESNLRAIGSFGTVEDFWRFYNHLVKPSKMENNSNYHLFKKGIKPMWEDDANANGGKWVVTIKQADKSVLDVCWDNLVLSLVGETLDEDSEVCGAVLSRRKNGDRIALWNKNRANEPAVLKLGHRLKLFLGVDASKYMIQYQSHDDSLRTGASYSNPSKYKI